MFYDEKISKTTEAYYLEPGLCSSITDIVEAMNTIIQERINHRDTCITIKVSKITQKVKLDLANEESSPAVFSTDLGHIFGGDVRNNLRILLRGKGPHAPTFAYVIVRIHSLMIYTDIVEYNFVGDTKAPLLRCFPFISKLKYGDLITTGQYMNYQTLRNLQFRRLLKNSFHSKNIDLRDTSGEKIPFVSVGTTRFVLLLRKVFDIHFSFVLILVWKMVASNTLELPDYNGIGRQRERGFGAPAQVVGTTAILFLRKYIDRAANRVGADLLEFAVPEEADVVSGKKFQNCCQKRRKTDIEKTTWKWQAKENQSGQKIEAKHSVTQRHFH